MSEIFTCESCGSSCEYDSELYLCATCEYIASYVNGNHEFVCREILAGPNPTVMAAKVTLRLAAVGPGQSFPHEDAQTFIRILESQTEKTVVTLKTESITLLYTCDECKTTATQSLSEIVESGTAVCPNCDTDMVLDDTIRVQI